MTYDTIDEKNWREMLCRKVRDCKIEVIGHDDAGNFAHGKALVGVLSAFGDSPAGFVYVEPGTAKSSNKPADIVLCHPDVGLLVIEVKGYSIEQIDKIQAGSLFIRSGGLLRPENHLKQASNTMFEIKTAVERSLITHHNAPLVNFMVAYPRISATEWQRKRFHQCLPMQQILLKEDLETPSLARDLISRLVQGSMQEAHYPKPLTVEHLEVIKKAFGDSATINVSVDDERVWKEIAEPKFGAYIDEQMSLEKHLSREQEDLSRLPVQGYPRLIRGVAGSGKTIVLANQVCRFIRRNLNKTGDLFQEKQKELRVAAVCFNRSLVQFINKKVRDAYKHQTLEGLPPNIFSIRHFEGLLWELSEDQGELIPYISYEGDKKHRARKYLAALSALSSEKPEIFETLLYDAIFIDEGQDLEEEEFQVLHKLIRPDAQTGEKTFIIFYDDAQNLYGKQRPNWAQLGIDLKGRSHVMRECFRNTKEIVSLAFNILLGSQAPEDQKAKTRTFADVSYLKQIGLIEELPTHFKVNFAERTYQSPTIHKFSARNEERQWLVQEVLKLIREEHVRPDDILILFYGPKKSEFQDLVASFQQVKEEKIRGYVKPYDKSQDRDEYIFRKDHLTISTVNGAKGYDAPIVFIAGADLFETSNEGRAAFYVGATRAKLMLYISGLEKAGTLFSEAEKLSAILK